MMIFVKNVHICRLVKMAGFSVMYIYVSRYWQFNVQYRLKFSAMFHIVFMELSVDC